MRSAETRKWALAWGRTGSTRPAIRRSWRGERDDARLWLRQAEDGYRFGRRPVIGHSARALLARLNARAGVTGDLLTLGGQLDQYYVSTRYPDALPGIIPADAFSAAQAGSALAGAQRILRWARTQLRREP
jgi:hypothetical protein